MSVFCKKPFTACFLTLGVSAAVLFAGCGKAGQKASARPNTPVLVETVTVAPETISEMILAVGDTKAADEAVVFSKVSGKIIDYKVREGDRIQREQVIATIDRDEIGYKFQEAPVLSPIAGTVGRTYLDRGAQVRADTPVALMVNLDEVRIRIQVVEQDVPKLKLDQAALLRVEAFPSAVFTGRVTRISPVIDISTRTAPAEITVPNPNHTLLPGMFAKVEIIARTLDRALVIPEQAISFRGTETWVHVIADSTARRKKVVTGIRIPGKAQIVEGLKAGEVLVVAGQQKLQDGTLVSAKETVQ